MIDLSKHPFPVTYRELWLPGAINGTNAPSSVQGGHAMTLTGAVKRTTADGVHGTGALTTSKINLGAIHNGQATFWVSFRFKIDQTYAIGSGNQVLWKKSAVGTDLQQLYLESANGILYFQRVAGGAQTYALGIAGPWTAGVCYHVLASVSAANGVRFRIDNGAAQTNADLNGLPAAGDMCLLADSLNADQGLIGVITDVTMGTDDLTANEEADLYKGIPPADAVHVYTLDEGRGVTANDRGSGANNGTLGAACSWAFGPVEQPCLSFDGINDRAVSSSGIYIKQPYTFVWVGKMKSTYNALTVTKRLYELVVDANNRFMLVSVTPDAALTAYFIGGGTTRTVSVPMLPAIDDYWIVQMTLSESFVGSFYLNGYLVGSAAAAAAMSAAAATAYIGHEPTPSQYDVSRPLFCSLIDGAFTARQALIYSRWLRDVFNLPVSM